MPPQVPSRQRGWSQPLTPAMQPSHVDDLRGFVGAEPLERCDVVVVGAGVVGLAVARELIRRRPGAAVQVLERDWPGAHQSSHNSGVIHAGMYYKPGSLKARLCVQGAQELYEFCAEHSVDAQRIGKVIVARTATERPVLRDLLERGRKNGVEGLRIIGSDELHELEPHCVGVAALLSPNTGVVDYPAVVRALARDCTVAGVRISSGCSVTGLAPVGGGVEVVHSRGTSRTCYVISCAGSWADRLARRHGAGDDCRVVPFRGAYLSLRRDRAALVRSNIYPVPDPALPFLGVHFTRTVTGEVVVGPTALLVGSPEAYRLTQVELGDLATTLRWPGTWRMARRWWRAGLAEAARAASVHHLVRDAQALVPDLKLSDVEPGFAGVRGQALARTGDLLDDFIVTQAPGVLHIRNAPSPAATSCLSLGRLIVDRAVNAPDFPYISGAAQSARL